MALGKTLEPSRLALACRCLEKKAAELWIGCSECDWTMHRGAPTVQIAAPPPAAALAGLIVRSCALPRIDDVGHLLGWCPA